MQAAGHVLYTHAARQVGVCRRRSCPTLNTVCVCCLPPAVCPAAAAAVQVFTGEGLIYMVQEYGEIDLARLLAKHEASRKEAGAQRDNLDENFIRLYWQQMLQVSSGCCGHVAAVSNSAWVQLACWWGVLATRSRCMQRSLYAS